MFPKASTLRPYLFLLPAFVLFATFSIYPFYLLGETSLFEWDGIREASKQFVGLRNYWDTMAHSPRFWQSFRQAGWVTLLALTLQNALALLLAMAVNRNLKGALVYRTIFFLPPILSGIVVGLVWLWIYDGNYGILNTVLELLHLGSWTRSWLADKDTALNAIAVIHMWKGFGWGFIIFLAGLQTIPNELYEAARVDGAGSWSRFRYITVPLLMPVFILVSILTILGTMQIFDIIVATTKGAPAGYTEVPIIRIYTTMLDQKRFGFACAEGIIFGVALLIFSLLQMRFQKQAT